MKTPDGILRTTAYLLFVLFISAGLAACGGGGTTSSGGNASPSVAVSIASAPSYPAGTTFATSTSSPATAVPPGNSPDFDHVWVTVTKIALIPSTGTELPDGSGETESPNSPAEEGGSGLPGFKTATLSTPVKIDLLNPTLDNAALLLNTFSGVPAGEYSKIRLYYDNVVGAKGDNTVTFHPTAHYHFDVHFVGGNLVIPVTTDLQGIRFYSVVINVVGLKYHQAGQSGNVLLRPQVFATADNSSLKYIVHGDAEHVNPSTGRFNVITAGNDNILASYSLGTRWFYADGRLVNPYPLPGSEALQDNAIVDVIGTFQGGVLVADEVDITFPAVLSDNVYHGWNTADNTITLRFTGDNVVSVPNALRNAVYYDNAAYPYGRLTDAAIVDNVFITARGYATGLGIKAFWISIGP